MMLDRTVVVPQETTQDAPIVKSPMELLDEKTRRQLELPDFGGDMELVSEFLQRKDSISQLHEKYLRENPQVRDLLSDYLQTVLLQKPADVFAFTRAYFSLPKPK